MASVLYGITREKLYLTGYGIVLLVSLLTTTMFKIPYAPKLLILLGLLLIISKMLWFDSYIYREVFWGSAVCLLGALIFFFTRELDFLLYVLVLLGAKGISFRKIIKMFVLMNCMTLFLAFIASRLDVIEDLVYVDRAGYVFERNSFGMIYPTDFAAHICFLMLGILYLLGDKIKKIHLLCCFILMILVYVFCHTRLDCGCMLIAILGFSVCRGWLKTSGFRCSNGVMVVFFKKYGMYIMPLFAFVIMGLAYIYTPDNFILKELNNILSQRLNLGHKGLLDYPVTLFGQHIKFLGNGGTLAPFSQVYFFIDCSYQNILMRYGVLGLLAVFLFNRSAWKKCTDNKYMLVVLVVVAINGVVAHHIWEIAYNPFFLASTAFLDRENASFTCNYREFFVK